MNRLLWLGVVAVVAVAAAVAGGYAAFRGAEPADGSVASEWKEVAWRFPIDQWGTGRAFSCQRTDCAREVSLYLRAKLGSCNCTTGVANDDDVDRMSDFDLLGGEAAPLAPGKLINVGVMKGRVRAYTLAASGGRERHVISVVVNDRCDMIVATAVLPRDRLDKIEPAVMNFLNSPSVVQWTEVAIGL
jgi:hypothetical protein